MLARFDDEEGFVAEKVFVKEEGFAEGELGTEEGFCVERVDVYRLVVVVVAALILGLYAIQAQTMKERQTRSATIHIISDIIFDDCETVNVNCRFK